MNSIGAIYLTHPERVTIGRLAYDAKQDNALWVMDPVNLITACRATELSELCAFCLPRIEAPRPYLLGDGQVCLKTKRIKMGWMMTDDDETGSVIYSIRLDVKAILKRFDCLVFHFHSTNVKEEKDGD